MHEVLVLRRRGGRDGALHAGDLPGGRQVRRPDRADCAGVLAVLVLLALCYAAALLPWLLVPAFAASVWLVVYAICRM